MELRPEVKRENTPQSVLSLILFPPLKISLHSYVFSRLPTYNAGDRMTTLDAVAPTPAQWRAAQVKHVELLQALRDAQVEIEQLKAERDSLNVECLALHAKNGDLHWRDCPSPG